MRPRLVTNSLVAGAKPAPLSAGPVMDRRVGEVRNEGNMALTPPAPTQHLQAALSQHRASRRPLPGQHLHPDPAYLGPASPPRSCLPRTSISIPILPTSDQRLHPDPAYLGPASPPRSCLPRTSISWSEDVQASGFHQPSHGPHHRQIPPDSRQLRLHSAAPTTGPPLQTSGGRKEIRAL